MKTLQRAQRASEPSFGTYFILIQDIVIYVIFDSNHHNDSTNGSWQNLNATKK